MSPNVRLYGRLLCCVVCTGKMASAEDKDMEEFFGMVAPPGKTTDSAAPWGKAVGSNKLPGVSGARITAAGAMAGTTAGTTDPWFLL